MLLGNIKDQWLCAPQQTSRSRVFHDGGDDDNDDDGECILGKLSTQQN